MKDSEQHYLERYICRRLINDADDWSQAISDIAAKTHVAKVSELQPVARHYCELLGIKDGEYIVNWRFINWTSRIYDAYIREYGMLAMKERGTADYIEYVRKVKDAY